MEPIQLAGQLDAEFKTACARARCDQPWYGALVLEVSGKGREYRVGRDARPDLRVLSWQHPYARAFYEGAPGARFTLDADETEGFAPVDGVIERRARVASRDRALTRVDLEHRSGRTVLVREGESFVDEDDAHLSRVASHGLPDVLALLTPEQYRLITTAHDRPVILQGRAGSGKTTVALHRVAWLTHPDARVGGAPVDPANVLVVMFNRALSAFVDETLGPLGLRAVQLHTFHAWALAAIRKAYAGEISPKASKAEGREVSSALKRQLGILTALDAMVQRQIGALFTWLDERGKPYRVGEWLASLREGTGPIVPRLITLRKRLMQARDQASTKRERARLEQLVILVRGAKERMTLYKEELLRFLTDKPLLRQHLEASDEQLDQLAAHQQALQGEGGSERRPGPNVAFEDFALILRLIQLKNGGLSDKEGDDVFLFDHLVIDEAQDFGAVELATLLAAVRSRTGVTIVGDLNQKIIPEADFIGWDALAEQLGLSGAEVAKLEVAHRSTRPIVELASAVAGDGEATGRAGPKPTLVLVGEPEALAREIARIARSAIEDRPSAHVCVVCRSPADAVALKPDLATAIVESGGDGAIVRVGHNADFHFGPGITVTNVRQIKGLEFDFVIVVEPDEVAYPADEQGRRWLYTVLTRAKESLYLVASRPVTPLLDAAKARGLVEVEDLTDVVPVQLGVGDDEPF